MVYPHIDVSYIDDLLYFDPTWGTRLLGCIFLSVGLACFYSIIYIINENKDDKK